MTDKVQKIREEVERLKLCTMDEHMKFYSESAEAEYNALCKIDAYIDSLQEEPVSEDLGQAANVYVYENAKEEWSDCDMHNAFVSGAEWQKLKDMGITNNSKGVVTNILNSSDKSLDIYATEVAFIMLPANLTENYHTTNRDRISDAVRLGANWQKKQDQETIELAEDHAMLAGMEKMKEQMMTKAVETTFNVSLPCGVYDKLKAKGCEDGDKLLVIKKDEI